MPERPFQIFGDSIPRMIGRRAVMDRLLRGLAKPVPDHMQIVGPRSAGKTVLVNELVKEIRLEGSSYGGAVRWNLGHQPPGDDQAFLAGLRDHTASALDERHAYWAGALRDYRDQPLDGMKEVLGALNEEDIKVLVVLDGFDKPLASGSFTRNLWDNLADLGRRQSLRYVTTSRKRLHDLIRDSDSAVSDFWGIFDQNPVTLGCFDDDDIAQVIASLAGTMLSAGARTELLNFTNAFPPLMLCVLNELVQQGASGEINQASLMRAAQQSHQAVEALLDRLWKECSVTAKELQRTLISDGNVSTSGISPRDIDQLVERGFGAQHGGQLHRPCLLLKRFLEGLEDEGSSLRLLFGTEGAFFANAKGLLEHRLNQLPALDRSLRRSLERGIEDLPDHADNCIGNVRNIVDRALDLIWTAELNAGKIPDEWFAKWDYNNETSHNAWKAQFPAGRGPQVGLLGLITGTERSSPVARYVTRNSYSLLAAAHGFGNFGQHTGGAVVHPGTAVAAMMVCIEMAASLLRELPRAGA